MVGLLNIPVGMPGHNKCQYILKALTCNQHCLCNPLWDATWKTVSDGLLSVREINAYKNIFLSSSNNLESFDEELELMNTKWANLLCQGGRLASLLLYVVTENSRMTPKILYNMMIHNVLTDVYKFMVVLVNEVP